MIHVIAMLVIAAGAVSAQEPVPLGEVIEAESLHAVNAEEETRYAEDASGGAYVYLPHKQMEDAKPNAYLEVPIADMVGQFRVRVRAYALSNGTDSLRYGVAGPWFTQGLNEQDPQWRWYDLDIFGVRSGVTILLIGAREPARIDALEVIRMGSEELSPHQRQPVRPEPNEATPIGINPPTFRWLDQGEVAYHVQVARDEAFTDVVLDERVTTTFLRPLQPLPEGRLYWRWRADEWEEDDWVGPVIFELSSDAVEWPLPPWEESFEAIPEGRPRLWMTPERFEQMRAWAETDEGREAIEYWRGALESEIGRDLPLAEIPGKGEDLTREERVVQRVTFKREAGRTSGAMKNLAVFYALTGDEEVGAEARRRALLIADLDPRGYASHEVSDFGNGNLVEGMAFVYDYMHDYLTEEERATIRDAIRERLAITAPYFRRLEQRVHNAHAWQHTLLQFMAGCLAISEVPEAEGWFRWAVKATVALYPWFGGADGGSAEMANYFSGTNLRSSMHTRDLIYHATGIDLTENPWYRNNVYYTVYSHPPNHMRSQFGDHAGGPHSSGPRDVAYVLTRYRAALLDDPVAAAYAAHYDGNPLVRVRLVDTFNWLRLPVPEPAALSQLPGARLFGDIGVVYLHTAIERPEDNIFFEFKSGPYGSHGHSHDDQNTFNLAAFDEPLLVDTGYYHSYGDDHHAGWTMQTKAHNGILVDGTGQPNSSIDAFGRVIAFEQGDEYMFCAGEARWAYDQVTLDRFTRNVLAVKPDLFLVYDQIEAPDEHTWQYLLHAQEQMAVDEARQSMAIVRERGQCRVTLLEPAGLAIDQHHQFDPPAKHWREDRTFEMPDQWHLIAEPAAPSASQRFLAAIEVGRSGERFASKVEALDGEGWIGARIVRREEEIVAGFADALPALDGELPAQRMTLGGMTAEAFAAAVHLRDGEPVRIITVGGSRTGLQ